MVKQLFIFFSLIALFYSCSKDKTANERDLISCPVIWAPVCSLNGITYSNDCKAEAAGVLEYTIGVCI
ncbi:MAG: hypothetical protein CMC04_00180 [Flavobacteriaceae bacterium]|nr:hypothetical protein [Flavobacteriaceae bacterium]MBQ22190.1 hypothetical protein [Flavobacteriales bacterium]